MPVKVSNAGRGPNTGIESAAAALGNPQPAPEEGAVFKGMHPVFWVGLVLLYGYNLGMMAVEMLGWLKYGGSGPAPQFLYVSLISLLVINLFVAWLWVYVPERFERRHDAPDPSSDGRRHER